MVPIQTAPQGFLHEWIDRTHGLRCSSDSNASMRLISSTIRKACVWRQSIGWIELVFGGSCPDIRTILDVWSNLRFALHNPLGRREASLSPVSSIFLLSNFTFSSKWLSNWTLLPILSDKWWCTPWNIGAMPKESLFLLNVRTWVFVGLNWTKLEQLHSETHPIKFSISDTIRDRLSYTTLRGTFRYLVYRASPILSYSEQWILGIYW